MPIAPGDFADVLRVIGRIMDVEFAEEVVIVNQGSSVAASWTRKDLGPAQRQFVEQRISELRAIAKQSRVNQDQAPREGFVEMLRVIGQDLDREEKHFDRIVQDPGGFLLTMPGTTYVEPAQRKYLNSELISSSRRRREWRRPDPNAIDLSGSILYDIPDPAP